MKDVEHATSFNTTNRINYDRLIYSLNRLLVGRLSSGLQPIKFVLFLIKLIKNILEKVENYLIFINRL